MTQSVTEYGPVLVAWTSEIPKTERRLCESCDASDRSLFAPVPYTNSDSGIQTNLTKTQLKACRECWMNFGFALVSPLCLSTTPPKATRGLEKWLRSAVNAGWLGPKWESVYDKRKTSRSR